MREQIHVHQQRRRHSREETAPTAEVTGGPDDTTAELQLTTTELLHKISHDLVANSVEPIS